MMRSMFAGVSGLRSHQTMMDVIGNNVANVNTVGFKSSRVLFADALSQLIRGASSGTGEAAGGVTPQQVGLGTSVQATERVFSQGGTQLTGNATDVSIQGDGFFSVRIDGEMLYTRAGGFHFDNQGNLVDPTGGVVQGWRAGADGVIDRSVPVSDLRIPLGQSVDPVATSEVAVRGNLDARATVGDTRSTIIEIIDNQGIKRSITVEFEKTAANEWEGTVTGADGTVAPATFTAEFDASGTLIAPATAPSFTYTPTGGAAVAFDLDFGTTSGARLTQYGANSDAQAVSQNGMSPGVLRSFAIGPDGTISGVYSNGTSQALGQLAIASFADPKGLIATGDNRYRPSTTSGGSIVGVAGEGGRGGINAGTLEMSNVELSQEFTNLILAQRGFQANSRVITTSDEMIQELVNLKR
jgi:flagellar hook protein FlgE